MNRADERAFAWALADSAATFLRPEAHTSLCTKIGAGEQDSAIKDLLTFYAEGEAELPYNLVIPLQTWIRGYEGSDSELILRRLYEQIRVSIPSHQTVQAPEAKRHLLIASRSDRAMRVRLATAEHRIQNPPPPAR